MSWWNIAVVLLTTLVVSVVYYFSRGRRMMEYRRPAGTSGSYPGEPIPPVLKSKTKVGKETIDGD